MDYFCYISRTKVDQLLQTLEATIEDEWIERRSRETSADAKIEGGLSLGGVLSLFKGGATYGRKGVLQREVQIKTHYVEKLRKVLAGITATGPIPLLNDCILNDQFTSLYYHHKGRFEVEAPLDEATPGQVVTLTTDHLGSRVLLDCSLRFFSEGAEADGTFTLHSGNYRFFTQRLSLEMETVFVLLSASTSEIVGSPLFLTLHAGDAAL